MPIVLILGSALLIPPSNVNANAILHAFSELSRKKSANWFMHLDTAMEIFGCHKQAGLVAYFDDNVGKQSWKQMINETINGKPRMRATQATPSVGFFPLEADRPGWTSYIELSFDESTNKDIFTQSHGIH